MNTSYQVEIRINPGVSRAKVISKMADLFHVNADKLEHAFSNNDSLFKHGLDLDAAKKYQLALESCGCICMIEPDSQSIQKSQEANPDSEAVQISKIDGASRSISPKIPLDSILSSILVGILIIYILGHFTYRPIMRVYYMEAEKSWLSEPATIKDVSVNSITRRTSKVYLPVWTFEYTVGGRTYTEKSNGLENGYNYTSVNSIDVALNEGRKRPPESEVPIYYNPSNPNQAVIDRALWNGRDYSDLSLVAFAYIGVLFAFIKVYIPSLREKKANEVS
jgi:hypothetical protein